MKAKNGKDKATLSMTYAGARLDKAMLAGLSGRRRTECAYVASTVTDLPFFGQPVTCGEGGIFKVRPLGKLGEREVVQL